MYVSNALCWFEMNYHLKLETNILSRSTSLLADSSICVQFPRCPDVDPTDSPEWDILQSAGCI